MNKQILVIAGDGIGPEVTYCSEQILKCIADLYGHKFTFDRAMMGHTAIQKMGTSLPQETIQKAQSSDAILFGAIGHPTYDNNPKLKVRPEQGLLAIRKNLNLYMNIRPIMIFDELIDASPLKKEVLGNTDILFFRELTGGIYFGEKKCYPETNSASDLMIYSKEEIERITHPAMKAAQRRNKKLCSVDKANVLESSRLWRKTVQQIASEYPDVEVTHMFVDNMAMQLIHNPQQFDVILTTNLFGDILTDEASQITGSLGMLPSASMGGDVGLFEPIHGSAPTIAGQDKANPIASILSAALLLEYAFGLKDEGKAVINAIKTIIKKGFRTEDLFYKNNTSFTMIGTQSMGKKILAEIRK